MRIENRLVLMAVVVVLLVSSLAGCSRDRQSESGDLLALAGIQPGEQLTIAPRGGEGEDVTGEIKKLLDMILQSASPRDTPAGIDAEADYVLSAAGGAVLYYNDSDKLITFLDSKGKPRSFSADLSPVISIVLESKEKALVGLEELPFRQEVARWAEHRQAVEGLFQKTFGDYRVYMVAMGQKPTGGFAVEVDKVEKTSDGWLVDVRYVVPGPGDLVTEAITFPYEIVAIPNDGETVRFRRLQGRDFIDLTPIKVDGDLPNTGNIIVEFPEPGSRIESPLRIRGKARVYEATFTIEIEDGHNVLASKAVTALDAAPNWGGFDVSIEFEPATNPDGMIIFVTHDANDGRRVEELMIPVRFYWDK